MTIIIVTVSILVITATVWILNWILPLKICPICAGVSGTWLWILTGLYFGLLENESWRIVAALAMGGSVVGIAYQLEKKLSAGKSLFLWKTLFIPAGFIGAYGVLAEQWAAFLTVLIFLVLISFVFLTQGKERNSGNRTVSELEKKMKNCC